MKKHFVTFYSPGTFFDESTTEPIEAWDVDTAVKMSLDIVERHNAKPFGFRFTTRQREDHELDSHVVEKSPMYYLGGKVETLAEVEQRNSPDEDILRINMRSNGWDRIITNSNSWKVTKPLNKDDVVLEVTS